MIYYGPVTPSSSGQNTESGIFSKMFIIDKSYLYSDLLNQIIDMSLFNNTMAVAGHVVEAATIVLNEL